MGKRLIVLFPGVNYGVDCPLLYYAGFQYEVRGYEKIKITSYEVDNPGGTTDYEEYAKRAGRTVRKILQEVSFDKYEDIIFASKSIGTVIALSLEDGLQIKNVRHLLLTPIDLTLPLMEKNRRYGCIVSGTKDKWVDHEKLRKICQEKELPLTEIVGVGHRLETKESMEENLEIIKQVIALY